ncbi:MAG: hypothetical protein MRERV_3c072 [Mycoplasmataceae bacterium RV_VA103A]|nr:MAG: hypothetical protein MRERV_3c072 [Mycoplasmataceae bacterium RV_VA103A]
MKSQETQAEPTNFNYRKWGLIGIIILLVIGLLVWGYRRILKLI